MDDHKAKNVGLLNSGGADNRLNMRIFGYIVSIEKRTKNAERKKSGAMCKVSRDRKHLFVTMPDGTKIPCQISLKVEERVEQLPRATVEMFVDINDLLLKEPLSVTR